MTVKWEARIPDKVVQHVGVQKRGQVVFFLSGIEKAILFPQGIGLYQKQ